MLFGSDVKKQFFQKRIKGRGGRGGRGFRGLLFGRGRTGTANEQASQHAEAKKQCDGLFHET